MTTCPLVRIREELGLSRAELARLAGLSYSAVYGAETGLTLRPHRRLVAALGELGYDRMHVLKEHAGFWAAQRNRMLAQVKEVQVEGRQPS